MVAVPETAGVHWKTCSGESPELVAQLPACWLGPLVTPLKVPPCAGMTVGLLQSPARRLESWPSQTATPSRMQRPSMLFRQARVRPPAVTHAAISSRHAFRHCLDRDAASAEVATSSAASSVSNSAYSRVVGCFRIPQLPRASSSRAPERCAPAEYVPACVRGPPASKTGISERRGLCSLGSVRRELRSLMPERWWKGQTFPRKSGHLARARAHAAAGDVQRPSREGWGRAARIHQRVKRRGRLPAPATPAGGSV